MLEPPVVHLDPTQAYVRFDNGPEFVAHAVADWSTKAGTEATFVGPESSWQSTWIESFNGRLRDDLFNGWQFNPHASDVNRALSGPDHTELDS